MIQIERRTLGSLKQHTLPVSNRLHDLEARIGGELPQSLPCRQSLVDHRRDISRELSAQRRGTPARARDPLFDERGDSVGMGEIGNT